MKNPNAEQRQSPSLTFTNWPKPELVLKRPEVLSCEKTTPLQTQNETHRTRKLLPMNMTILDCQDPEKQPRAFD